MFGQVVVDAPPQALHVVGELPSSIGGEGHEQEVADTGTVLDLTVDGLQPGRDVHELETVAGMGLDSNRLWVRPSHPIEQKIEGRGRSTSGRRIGRLDHLAYDEPREDSPLDEHSCRLVPADRPGVRRIDEPHPYHRFTRPLPCCDQQPSATARRLTGRVSAATLE